MAKTVANAQPSEIMKHKDIAAMLNIERSTLCRVMKKGGFPEPIVLLKARCWRRQDILDWIASRPTVKR